MPVQTKTEDTKPSMPQQSEDDHLRVMKAFHEQPQDKSNNTQDNDDSKNDDESDSDDSDMFASPSSEDRARKEEKEQ